MSVRSDRAREAPEVVVTRALHCRPDISAQLLAVLVPVALRTRSEPGNVRFDVFRVRGAPDRLMVFERWTSREAMEAHWRQPHAQDALRAYRDHLAEPMEEGVNVLHLEDVVG